MERAIAAAVSIRLQLPVMKAECTATNDGDDGSNDTHEFILTRQQVSCALQYPTSPSIDYPAGAQTQRRCSHKKHEQLRDG
jgi:hypothetical protein